MRPRPLIWHIFSSYLLVILVAVAAVTGYTARSIRQSYQAQMAADSAIRARVATDRFLEPLRRGARGELQALCKSMGPELNARLTIILPSGEVAGDSEEDPARMDNHADRSEVKEAVLRGIGSSVRRSRTLGQDMMYVALPIRNGGDTLGVIRVSFPLTRLTEALWALYGKTATAGFIAAMLAAVISWMISRRLSRSLTEMKHGAERFARGDFSEPVANRGAVEMVSLAASLNQMARQLDDRIRAVSSQRNQQEAVLSSMVEGVIAVDNQGRIISLNQAAAGLLGVQIDDALGRDLREASQNESLSTFAASALETGGPVEGEFMISGQDPRTLQAQGTVLRDAQGEAMGAVVVLNDVTRLRRLEQVRRDFVANVSHELRTPITSIKGFVETLLDGAIEDPGDARRFLQIVVKQADRLNAILGDLLTLSRIEEEEKKASISLELSPFEEPLGAAVQLCESKALEKNVRIELDCAPELLARMNAPLIEQAVANLVDNAIKYSEAGGTVRVTGRRVKDEVTVQVRDEGCGIPAEHLSRLFERFYRVDKGRSRNLGGTGLGLSIVKHIAKVHGGRVTVESMVGQGSSFSIYLPGTGESA